MLAASALRSDGVNFDFCIGNRDVRGNLEHQGQALIQAALFHKPMDTDKRGLLGSETWKIVTYAPEDQQLTEFREAVDDAEPNFVPNLHLHHFGCKTGAHTLSIF